MVEACRLHDLGRLLDNLLPVRVFQIIRIIVLAVIVVSDRQAGRGQEIRVRFREEGVLALRFRRNQIDLGDRYSVSRRGDGGQRWKRLHLQITIANRILTVHPVRVHLDIIGPRDRRLHQRREGLKGRLWKYQPWRVVGRHVIRGIDHICTSRVLNLEIGVGADRENRGDRGGQVLRFEIRGESVTLLTVRLRENRVHRIAKVPLADDNVWKGRGHPYLPLVPPGIYRGR